MAKAMNVNNKSPLGTLHAKLMSPHPSLCWYGMCSFIYTGSPGFGQKDMKKKI